MKWRNLTGGYFNRISDMAKMSPHEILGLEPGCSQQEIKAAYLRMVKAYHPDKSHPFMARHNQEVIKLVNAAYEALKGDSL